MTPLQTATTLGIASMARPDLETCVIAMTNPGCTYDCPLAVRFAVHEEAIDQHAEAAERLNNAGFDVISLPEPFKQGQRFRAGIEGRISVLLRGRGMKRCRSEGAERFALFVAAGQVLSFRTKGSFAPPRCRMPPGQS
jgi:hypothetical protein